MHQKCYGLHTIPDGAWFCETCSLLPAGCPPASCVICDGEGCARGGPMKRAYNGQWVHVLCALSFGHLSFRDQLRLDQLVGVRTVATARCRTLRCMLCSRGSGACLQCRVAGCGVTFHPSCSSGLGLRVELSAAPGQLAAFCKAHSATAAVSHQNMVIVAPPTPQRKMAAAAAVAAVAQGEAAAVAAAAAAALRGNSAGGSAGGAGQRDHGAEFGPYFLTPKAQGEVVYLPRPLPAFSVVCPWTGTHAVPMRKEQSHGVAVVMRGGATGVGWRARGRGVMGAARVRRVGGASGKRGNMCRMASASVCECCATSNTMSKRECVTSPRCYKYCTILSHATTFLRLPFQPFQYCCTFTDMGRARATVKVISKSKALEAAGAAAGEAGAVHAVRAQVNALLDYSSCGAVGGAEGAMAGGKKREREGGSTSMATNSSGQPGAMIGRGFLLRASVGGCSSPSVASGASGGGGSSIRVKTWDASQPGCGDPTDPAPPPASSDTDSGAPRLTVRATHMVVDGPVGGGTGRAGRSGRSGKAGKSGRAGRSGRSGRSGMLGGSGDEVGAELWCLNRQLSTLSEATESSRRRLHLARVVQMQECPPAGVHEQRSDAEAELLYRDGYSVQCRLCGTGRGLAGCMCDKHRAALADERDHLHAKRRRAAELETYRKRVEEEQEMNVQNARHLAIHNRAVRADTSMRDMRGIMKVLAKDAHHSDPKREVREGGRWERRRRRTTTTRRRVPHVWRAVGGGRWVLVILNL